MTELCKIKYKPGNYDPDSLLKYNVEVDGVLYRDVYFILDDLYVPCGEVAKAQSVLYSTWSNEIAIPVPEPVVTSAMAAGIFLLAYLWGTRRTKL